MGHNLSLFISKLMLLRHLRNAARLGRHFCVGRPAAPDINDVVMLISDEEGSFINLSDRTLPLPNQGTLFHVKSALHKAYPDLRTIRVYSDSLVEYSDSTPMAAVLNDDFYLRLNDNEMYSVLLAVNASVFYDMQRYNLDEIPLNQVCRKLGQSSMDTAVITKFLAKSLRYVESATANENTVTRDELRYLLEKAMMSIASERRSGSEVLLKKKEVLTKKLALLLENKTEADRILAAKGRRKVKLLATAMFIQMALVQYGTYVAFSWDIMEPLTCLLGIFDLFVAYSFWLWTDMPYSLEAVQQRFIERNRTRVYRRQRVETEEILQCREMLDYLERKRLFLHAADLEDIVAKIYGPTDRAHLLPEIKGSQ
eukprot:TRINITY_DN12506_c0_g1_i1.p2 TRINITY_DN12506_c0_g1~~TRINITY_DN12506_c0_g1_i1.p2  ORF type:complete len:376 (+),score=93.56 TRINITY_DN12506_c0_g1_i1:23-1129(+)